MTPWMLDLFREQADEAFKQADLPRVRSCISHLIKFQHEENRLWNALAEALYQSQLWYEAALWCEAWARHDKTGEAEFFLARIDAQIGLFTIARTRLQQLPGPMRQQIAVVTLGKTIESELAALQQNVGSVTASMLLASAVEHHDMQALMLLAVRLSDSVKWTTAEQRHIGFAFYHSALYVKALNHLTLVVPWDTDVSHALVHVLLMMGDVVRARGLLDKQLGKKWNVTPQGKGLALRIAFLQSNEPQCLKILRECDAAALREPLFVDALTAWLTKTKAPEKIRNFWQAQLLRFGKVDAYWTIAALAAFRCGDAPAVSREALMKAIELCGSDAELWAKLASTLVSENNSEAAVHAYKQSLQYDPDRAETWQELALLSSKCGDEETAQTAFRRALALSPQNGALWSNYGNFLVRRRALQLAVDCGRVAVQFEPESVTCWNNLAAACLNQHFHLEAKAALDKALALDPRFVSALSNQARACGQLGEFDRALQLFDALPNKDSKTCNSMLFYANYHPDLSSEAIYAIYRRILDQHFPQQQYLSHDNTLIKERPLVIGYVSPDFRHHPCYHFIAPLIQQHDRQNFKLIAYSDVAAPDKETQTIKSAVDVWHDCAYLTDEQLAEQIRRDQVDILVDLAGHTNDNRLTLFARKPAPLQMTWLGFGYTTGLKQIDYFLTDEEMFPPGAESLFAETAARVPVPCFAYQPPETAPAIAAAPCQSRGYVSFGSLSRTVRLNKRCLQTWVKLLQRVPDSHLVLNSFSFAEPAMKQRYVDYFVQQGIGADRLDIDFETPPWPVYDRIDIMLDCFPHNSGTTLFEGLYMGVPFVTRRDRVSMGRLGATIARGLGRAEWIADSDEAYIDIAARLASDSAALAALRMQLREQLLHSALGDQKGFCQRVENIYRQIWLAYCSGQQRLSDQQQERVIA